MARKLRIQERGITHHVYSRCIEKRNLLNDHSASDLLVEVTSLAQDKYAFELIAYQIMDNHFHFVIRTVKDGESISTIMQYIKARYAERYNRIHERTGPFWNERFKDKIIEQSDDPIKYCMQLLWYLAFNPIRKNIASDPKSYRYSSINCYLDENYRSPLKITLHDYFLWLGNSFNERVSNFLAYGHIFYHTYGISV